MNLNEIVAAGKSLLPELQVARTRFRAYQLGTPGSSFSYFNGATFTLIEARMNAVNTPNIKHELKQCGKSRVDVLHITSWDSDHCEAAELATILEILTPRKIEYPGYDPSTQNGKDCLAAILDYRKKDQARITTVAITPAYIKGLTSASSYGYRDVVFHPKTITDKSNDNSTVQMFRTGCFNVLSLGDVESKDIAALLKSSSLCKEVDVLILPHHGADNGFLTSDLLDVLSPKLAVCSADHSNQYGHPARPVRDLLRQKEVEVATTIRGDVLVWSENGTSTVNWVDAMAGNNEIHKHDEFAPKKFKKLNKSSDNIRAALNRKKYPN
ncbi:hypothetical protein GJ699_21250 [Duganella sp. FT80W]|uniref:MBL fold metallo-hydrolase n=1 Tax=Duganella guangzhouensis TaxID=2666084 RepID=A0A6I2L460_9BURK|nr:hypothetical protein [Duganella guangzhouensis]MRW92530.1 hypothetical protein [Duganella guangzhouensis]